jgi:uncharacterized damage-inducible protein DinB
MPVADGPVFPEPGHQLSDPADLFVRYLDFYRETIAAKVDGLTDDQLRTALLPSGWTPIELVKHLVFMERRWLRWGFQGEDVDEPWGDNDPGTGRWTVGATESLDDLLAALRLGGERTRAVVEASSLSALASPAGRFADGDPPRLVWILFHVLQEYARHAGHLDVVRELIDGATGE